MQILFNFVKNYYQEKSYPKLRVGYFPILVFVDSFNNIIDLFVSYFPREMQQDKPGNITTLENINKRLKCEREREENGNLLNERIN